METKICTKCKRELPIENFRWKNKANNKRHSQCKECQSKQEKQHYKESLTRKKSVISTQQNMLERNTAFLNEIKSCGCAKCGDKRLYVLDFHHKDKALKDGTINHFRKSASLENLKNEVDKCIVLCANCHREFHYLEYMENISIDEYLDR